MFGYLLFSSLSIGHVGDGNSIQYMAECIED